jgi:hypothetical protein
MNQVSKASFIARLLLTAADPCEEVDEAHRVSEYDKLVDYVHVQLPKPDVLFGFHYV